ncbi:MAG: hypothetical protein JNL73_03560 [Anaerolineales bacterium]|nr:hypothetical protein [Anaerolineales bacterium]
MTTDRVEPTPEETHCEYCGAPLDPRERAIWDDGQRWPYCSSACVERDQHFRFTAQVASRPEPSLDGLTGLVIGVKRDGDVAVVLLERSDDVQIVIGFEKVTHVISLPAAHARVVRVWRRDRSVVFEFEPRTPARLEVRAATYTVTELS